MVVTSSPFMVLMALKLSLCGICKTIIKCSEYSISPPEKHFQKKKKKILGRPKYSAVLMI